VPLLLQRGMVQLDVVGSHTSEAGKNLSERSDDQILAMAEKNNGCIVNQSINQIINEIIIQ
jgi:hypothetical protein